MMGKTHFQIGVLSYVIASTVPAFNVLPFEGVAQSLTIAGMAVAGMAGLMADADSQHSKINHLNPVTGMAKGAINTLERIIETIIGFVFTLGIGVYILFNPGAFIGILSSLEPTKDYAITITYAAAILFILLGFMGRKGRYLLRNIPVIGNLYEGIMSIVYKGGNFLKRGAMILIYGGTGAGIIRYSYLNGGNIYLYLIGLLFIGIAIFPHRSFLHSIEGFILFAIAAWYLGNKIGHAWIMQPFMIGYFSHLYLTDALTKEGVPLSIIPMIINKLGLKKKLKRFKVYQIINSVLSFRVRLPLMSTGSTWGNIFESCYVIVLLIVAVSSFIVFNGNIKLI
ncbi:membrane-bound metal-dependent hydrolase YbcI (DUF457 family) [Anaerosolibacter carboniphilus]|uniref:Membrane-bound metal-dependent hydrolase YbcI (DUF457 family) n=1 Tax=Anaerosolibacter carboniphilus TaxID=1417629 RepID=A0A841KXZ0_9FIRM|nr:metal-dependent hydrolase [Anaerosolibacter carboniphilus]MBB6217158.1 membrane-bound metal-dependent hydrolase YbcI (DUF457 family) [Anaerosolibacter carboniphilus]